MTPIHLVILWHMHQPQYRDPASGRYLLPWTRLHGLKDYFGMVKMLEEFPGVHATFNLVPALGQQLQEYASGQFQEVWLDAAMAPAEELTVEEPRRLPVRNPGGPPPELLCLRRIGRIALEVCETESLHHPDEARGNDDHDLVTTRTRGVDERHEGIEVPGQTG